MAKMVAYANVLGQQIEVAYILMFSKDADKNVAGKWFGHIGRKSLTKKPKTMDGFTEANGYYKSAKKARRVVEAYLKKHSAKVKVNIKI